MNKITFSSLDGTKLMGIWLYPKNKTDKAIVLAHGITVDKNEDGIFTKLAELLADNGYTVFRFDFRGHGESEGRSVDITITKEIEDLTAAVDFVSRKGFKEIGLLGASFGGGISALYAGEKSEKLKCLCLWNPVLNYDHTFLNPTLPWILKQKGHIQKDFAEKGWSTIGSRKFVIGKQLFEDMKNHFPYQALKKAKLPVIILHGTDDDKVPYEDSLEYAKGVGELVTIEKATHGFHKEEEAKIAYEKTLDFFKKNL